MCDVHQDRYLEHLLRKRQAIEEPRLARNFWDVLSSRRSQRTFNGRLVKSDVRKALFEAVRLAPSSCNRQAIVVSTAAMREDLERLDSLLVGGRGWLGEAALGILLFADMSAYKSPAEVDFMPYLDAGCVIENLYLAAEALGLGACYVNPNIREENRKAFQEDYNDKGLLFCGLMAFGYYDARAPESPKRTREELFY